MIARDSIITTCRMFLVLQIATGLMTCNAFGQKLKGKVRSYRDTYYSVHDDFGIIKKSSRLDDPLHHDQFVLIDENGNIAEMTEYNPDGTIYCKCIGRCDYSDNHIESSYVRFYPEVAIDRKPCVLASVSYSLGKMCEMTYRNDTMGRPVEQIITDPMGRELSRIMIKRDKKGKPVVEKFSNGTTYMYKYDKDGRKTEWIKGLGGDTTRTFYKYDFSGNIIEMKADNYYKSCYKYHYDIFRYKYRYDKHGNWIKRTDYENDLPVRIVVRSITYQED